MDKVLLKMAAIHSVVLMLAVVTLSFTLKYYQSVIVTASSMAANVGSSANHILEVSEHFEEHAAAVVNTLYQQESITHKLVQMDQNILKRVGNPIEQDGSSQLGENYIIIDKPRAKQLSISFEDLYINRSIRITISGMTDAAMTSANIVRVREKEIFSGDPVFLEEISIVQDEDGNIKEAPVRDYGNDVCHEISIQIKEDPVASGYSSQITMVLDSVYVYTIYEDTYHYYIDLKKPSEVYDKILVIDAGHGGKDGGAVSTDGAVFEKNINLDIVLQLKKLLDKEDIKVYFTRTGDDKVFLRPRAELANSVDCDYFISIHCNSNGISSPNGTEILYRDTDYKGVESSYLAKIFSEEIGNAISLKRRGTIEKRPGDIFIMDQSQVPMILIEVGYMSNQKDLAYLMDPENTKAVARGIYQGIMRAYKELPVSAH